jgi:glycosyltransferase involved in cell wall biosynthesis
MKEKGTPIRPRVVHLIAPAPFGGAESVVATLAKCQSLGSGDVAVAVVLSPGTPDETPFLTTLVAAGVRIYRLNIPDRAYLTERRKLRALLETLRPQIAHSHGYRPDVLDAPVARGLGIATVTTVHGFTGGGLRNRAYEWMQRRAFRRFDAVVAVSRQLSSQLEADGVPARLLHVVPNAWEPTRPFLDRSEARLALGIPQSAFVVGWVGRITSEKGPDVMVRALGGLDSHMELSMVGSGAMTEQSVALSESLGVASRIRWHGTVPDAAAHLRAFDVLCITSWTEGTPMVLLEAMAAEVPLVVTSVGGIPDVISPREGTLVRAGDVKGIADGLQALFADPEAGRERAHAATARLAEDFAVEPWIQRYWNIYASFLENRPTHSE